MTLYLNEKIFALLLSKELNIEKLIILLILYNNKVKMLEEYFHPEKNLDSFTEIRTLELMGYVVREENLSLSITQYGMNFIKKYLELIPTAVPTERDLDGMVEKKEEKVNDELFKFCLEFTSLFKKENTGIAGKYQRVPEVAPKMKRFLKEFSYSKEDILKCTKEYIETLKNSGDSKFIMECGYFIYKRVDLSKDSEKSKLASLLENYTPKEKEVKVAPRETTGLF